MELNKLKVLSCRLNKITPYINKGGCCVVAALMAPLLNKHVYTKIRVLSKAYEHNSMDNARLQVVRNTVTEWNNNGVIFGHILLEMSVDGKTWWYDTDGLYSTLPYEQGWGVHDGVLMFDEAIELAKDRNSWNEKFNRSAIWDITRAIHQFFDESIHLPLQCLQMGELTSICSS